MSSLDFFREPRTPRLSALLKEIQAGQIRVPRFQRPFVWTDEQRLELLESIYFGYPIGSILVWRTQTHRLATYDRLGPVTLPLDPADKDTGVHQYLLDGHQRLITLFVTLGPGLYNEDERARLREQLRDNDIIWPIYFDLEVEEGNPFRLCGYRESPGPLWLPLSLLYDSYALGEFKDRLRTDGAPREMVNRVQSVADVFRDYTVPVMPIATEALDQVTTSFKRINSGGTSMSEVHMITALTWKTDFDLQEHLDDIASSLEPVGWNTFEPQLLLNICKAFLGLDVYKTKAEKLADGVAKDPSVLTKARDSLARVAGILDTIAGIRGPAVLPYAYQAVLLADALQELADPEPSAAVCDKLRQWFWFTSFTEHFRGMTSSLFTRTQAHLRALVRGQGDAQPPDTNKAVDALRRFDFRGVRSRAMALLLAEQGPRDPRDADSDPYSLLAEHGNECMVKLVANKDLPRDDRYLAQGPENRFLIHPRSGRELREALRDGNEELARSHAVSLEALNAYKQGDWSRLLRVRRASLMDIERRRAEEVGLEYRDADLRDADLR